MIKEIFLSYLNLYSLKLITNFSNEYSIWKGFKYHKKIYNEFKLIYKPKFLFLWIQITLNVILFELVVQNLITKMYKIINVLIMN